MLDNVKDIKKHNISKMEHMLYANVIKSIFFGKTAIISYSIGVDWNKILAIDQIV